MSFILLGILQSQAAGGGAAAYDLLETQVLTSSASSVTFTGLGSYSDYKHLQLRMTVRNTGASENNLGFRLNADSSSSYASHRLYGNGSSVISNGASSLDKMLYLTMPDSSDSSNIFGAAVVDVLDFSSVSKNTTFRWFWGMNGADTHIGLGSGLWNNTNAVTSLQTFPFSGNFVAGSRFSLMGVK